MAYSIKKLEYRARDYLRNELYYHVVRSAASKLPDLIAIPTNATDDDQNPEKKILVVEVCARGGLSKHRNDFLEKDFLTDHAVLQIFAFKKVGNRWTFERIEL